MDIRIGRKVEEKQAQNTQNANNSQSTSNNQSSNVNSNYGGNNNYATNSIFDQKENQNVANQPKGQETEKSDADSYKDVSYYEDHMKMSANDAIDNLINSGLFEGQGVNQYRNRMINAVNCLIENDDWKVNMDADGDGVLEDVNLADAVASSFDSELDLYIMEEVNKVMKKYGTCSKSYLGEKAIAELAEKGIVVDSIGSEEDITNRVYTFSLVDENGNVLTDANGKKGSYIFADCLIPDGCAQGAEINLSSILDQMGYDCVSKADYMGDANKESDYQNMLAKVQENIEAGLYKGNGNLDTLYGHRKDILQSVHDLWGGSGAAPGMFGIGGGDGELTPEELKKLEEEEKEIAKKEADKSDLRDELMQKAIQQYKDEHNGEKPKGIKLQIIEADVDLAVSSKFGF